MVTLDWAEARRYLGLKQVVPELEEKLRQTGELLIQAAAPKGVWRRFPLSRRNGRLCFAGLEVSSVKLEAHLDGCREVYLLAATLGVGVDRLLERLAVTDVSAAVMAQACAAAFLEGWCDRYQDQIAAEVSAEALFLRPRFSPGYGDFPLDTQPALLSALEAGKRIGLTATGANMLAPTKSVTAVIGLSPEKGSCHAGGCATCGKKDCAFRRVEHPETELHKA